MKTYNIRFGDTIMRRMHKTRIRFFLAIGLLAAILAQQNAEAQVGYYLRDSNGNLRRTTLYSNLPQAFVFPGETTYYRNGRVRVIITNQKYLRVINATNWHARIFDGVFQVEHLEITHSPALTNLPAVVFDNLSNLKTLTLRARRLQTLPAGVYDHFSRDRTSLDINHWNLLPPPSGRITIKPASLEVTEGIDYFARFHVNLVEANTNKYSRPIRLKAFWHEDTSLYLPLYSFNYVGVSSQSPTSLLSYRIRDNGIDDIDQRVINLTILSSQETFGATPLSGFRIDADAYEELKRSNSDPVFLPGEGVDEAGLVWTGTVTITDNNGPPTVSLSMPLNAPVVEVAEGDSGDTNVEVPVQRIQASATSTSVRYATQDGTAIAGQDYTATSGTLTFPAGTTNLTRTISIPILGDTLDEPNEMFIVILSNPTNSVIQPRTVRIEIIDDDEPAPPVNVNNGGAVVPIITPFPSRNGGSTSSSLMFQPTSLSLSESGSATYQVRATTLLPDDMIVRIRSNHPQVVVEPQTLVFTTTTLLRFQAVQVRAAAHAADIGEPISIVHSIDASEGFTAHENAGALSVTISSTAAEIETDKRGVEVSLENTIIEPQLPPTDYDRDDDGLIDVSNLAQLHALRFDLNGDGQPDKEEVAAAYKQAFPSALANMGIPADVPAQGYELTTNLNFDTNEDKTINEEDAFGNKGKGWPSIGSFSQPFQAVFEGNGHKIANLFQNQSAPALFANEPSGLFGAVGHRAQVIHVVLEGVEIRGVNWVGALAGLSQGVLVNCSVRGRVVGYNSVGGLVGHNFGEIADSHVRGEVRGETSVGGLVGWNVGGLIEGSSALGQETLGLVGFGTPAAR